MARPWRRAGGAGDWILTASVRLSDDLQP
jgi:hypothetical protein